MIVVMPMVKQQVSYSVVLGKVLWVLDEDGYKTPREVRRTVTISTSNLDRWVESKLVHDEYLIEASALY